MSNLRLSVVVIARNEQVNIRRCLASVAWSNDIVVIDDYSTDETAQLAMRFGARVLQNRFVSFADQRNWAISHANLRHPWVLMLDADEAATPELEHELSRVLSNLPEDLVGFKMCRKTMFHGTWLRFSDGFPVWIVRLVRVGRFLFQDSGHGEVAVPAVDGCLGSVAVPFLHFPFSKGLHDWCERHNRYSTLEAEKELTEASFYEWRHLFSSDRAIRRQAMRTLSRTLPCRSFLRFVYQYVFKGGILDGEAGLEFSWLMAVYEGLIVLKRRELSASRNEGRTDG